MAKLPDSNILGQLPQPGSRRPTSTIDVSGYARGAAAIGSGTEALGKGITSAAKDVAAVLQKEREADDKLELARANGYLNAALINCGNAIGKATKADGLVETYTTKINEAVDTAARSITSPRAREIFTLNAKDNALRIVNAAESKASRLARDAGIATDIDTMAKLRDGAIAAGPDAVQSFAETVHSYVDAWQAKGWIDRSSAAQLKKAQAEDFARGKLATLSPAERLDALHGVEGARYGVLAQVLPADVREQLRVVAEREHGEAAGGVSSRLP